MNGTNQILRLIAVSVLLFISCSEKKSENKAVQGQDGINCGSIEYSRAREAVIWAIPAVNYDMMYQAFKRDVKGRDNQLLFWSKPADWKNQTLGPNYDVLYIMPFFTTKEKGPMVLEIPAADKDLKVVGTIMDCWQMPLEDVGPAGADKGKGGKYAILPPDYKGKLPDGYIALQSGNFQGFALLRVFPKSYGQADMAAANAYLKKIRLYPLSQAASPPQSVFVDAKDIVYDAVIPYDIRFYVSIDRIVQSEPCLAKDKLMINMLTSIGIKKGQKFEPDPEMKKMLDQAAKDTKGWFDRYYETKFEPYFPDSRWFFPVPSDVLKEVVTGFNLPDAYSTDVRGTVFSVAFATVKHMGAGQFYLFVSRDKSGKPLEGGKNYVLHVPAEVPVNLYWSLTLGDFATAAPIRGMSHASRSSLTTGLQANADGSVDIYTGPKAPAGKEANWIPTKEGGRFEAIVRFYGPEKPLFDKTWTLPDIEQLR